MFYWNKKEKLCYHESQLEGAFERGILSKDAFIPLEDDFWIGLVEQANATNQMVTSEGEGLPHLAPVATSEMDTLLYERDQIDQWLRDHDYIGTKIATGRATREEDADVITEMDRKATRKNEIDDILSKRSKTCI